MPPPLNRRGRTVLALLLALAASTGCARKLPMLEDYQPRTDDILEMVRRTRVAEWRVGPEGDLDSTVLVLEQDADEEVRRRAGEARRAMDRIRDRRRERVASIDRDSLERTEYIMEVSRVGTGSSEHGLAPDIEALRAELLEEVLVAERAGRIEDAIELAGAAGSLDALIDTPRGEGLRGPDPLRLARRNLDRMKLIRLFDPALATRMRTGGGFDREDGFEPVEWPVRTPGDLARLRGNTVLVTKRMMEHHVSSPAIEQLHRAGLQEILFMCEVLRSNGRPIPEAYLGRIRALAEAPLGEDTASLLRAVQEAESSLAGDALPPGFSFRAFGDGVAASLDKQTSVVWPDEYQQYLRTLSGGYRGIGVRAVRNERGEIELTPAHGGPATRAGIRRGDVVLELEGVPAERLTIEELTRMATDPDRDTLRLRVRHRDGIEEDVVIDIGEVKRPVVTGWRQTGLDEEGTPVWSWLVDPGTRIGFVRLEDFRMGAEVEIREALQGAQAEAEEHGGRLEGLVLDLRGNPGGQVFVAVDVCNIFMQGGKAFQSDGRDEDRSTLFMEQDYGELEHMPLVVLIDERSASASELVSGVLRVNPQVLVVGERSFGKGSVQTMMDARTDDCVARVTTAWYRIPDPGDVIKGASARWKFVDRERAPSAWGVGPDVVVPLSSEEMSEISDRRARWHSGVGGDVVREDDREDDPATEIAVGLLRAKILDEDRSPDSADP
ncbi:MAG: S41 family peptidase [Planctomycetota bacterium]|nr:S41 family peptidase [Planctomycetota bacterium]MED6306704.1 S41 family peptidase [Planctomycetota bacterium]